MSLELRKNVTWWKDVFVAAWNLIIMYTRSTSKEVSSIPRSFYEEYLVVSVLSTSLPRDEALGSSYLA